ncbi:hypothetical protein [Chryseobacterium scophthalmum]|uniref:Uncharacterized protein n=1 Tax=Chryseobacterium scophthalmum TaxID=59733 RepID=A0A1N6E9R9_9FLAO|nr:hypothetical protein [Chryseobacterium scophthalmum]SIN79647.1 hypothetical protein SAMN05421769_0044 [Chryseobacterium scophthalmum]
MKYTDVFVPGGFPQHTYNPRRDKGLEEKIEEANNNLCKLVTITGQTKSGKTVLTKKIYPKDTSIWIDGGSIKTEDDFWNSLIDKLEYFQVESFSMIEEKSGSSSTENHLKGGIKIIEGGIKSQVTEGDKTSTVSLRTKNVSTKISAINALEFYKTPLIIDDFHYIERELQGSIIRALKAPIFEGVPVLIIAIPHKRYDAMKVEKEMTGRISQVSIPIWTSEELRFIADTGFSILKEDISNKIIDYLTNEAFGSPHLMQEFCRNISKILSNGEALSKEKVEVIFSEIADNIGRPIFEKLMRGPRQRTDRIQRKLKSGETVDIYGLILKTLAYLKPGLVSIEYEELRQGMKEILLTQMPQIHEVARVLKTMSRIAATDESSAPVIDFDDVEKKLHITDPFFSFYLKWGKI